MYPNDSVTWTFFLSGYPFDDKNTSSWWNLYKSYLPNYENNLQEAVIHEMTVPVQDITNIWRMIFNLHNQERWIVCFIYISSFNYNHWFLDRIREVRKWFLSFYIATDRNLKVLKVKPLREEQNIRNTDNRCFSYYIITSSRVYCAYMWHWYIFKVYFLRYDPGIVVDYCVYILLV